MENTPAFHPLDYVSVLRRRMWWLIVPLVVAAAVGAALVAWLPRQYQTTTTLGVALSAVSEQLVSNAQKLSLEERQRNITQVLFSPMVLERVAREEGLDKSMPLADAVQSLRSRVDVRTPPPDPGLPPGSVEQFFVSYKDSTPEATQNIANRLADVFVDESSKKREIRAEETSSFIAAQLADSQTRLSDLEGRLRTSKEAFMGSLPEQTNANVAMVTGMQQQLETTTNAIRGEQDRLSVIERQIETMKSGSVTADVAAPGVSTSVSAASTRLLQAERDLNTARAAYTERHPEVIRLADEFTKAKAAAAAEASRPEAERTATLQVDPAYRALLVDREQGRLRIRELQRQEGQIRGQIGMYRTRVESAPRVEQQIATLQREYELEKGQYAALTTRLRNSEMAENLERNRGGEQFAVLARAPLPRAPFSPNTQRLMIVTLLVGICAGAGLAAAREYLDRSIHDARALSDLDLPVLGEIPRIAHA
jgi:polysaccharide chain length determinant protein (PEP-CTERM system associated)